VVPHWAWMQEGYLCFMLTLHKW